jgi:hypothetical protein
MARARCRARIRHMIRSQRGYGIRVQLMLAMRAQVEE